ncbi:DNA polymerase III subunit delta [Thiomicrorhabdus sp. ZW0627]|uniref:DNA polymerase III subunit delta n=1 Tax=Thiomicrorhabdus sp. ZW0627 TaxID=3039774 RepID=UPI00243723E7|nr:DNA polymerase III subunit delta [Thiomicrorhabdus sp. ZW0627]MDG6774762.1 DNA polymerase III subunit delta [Thiomicrorhabdus sp. ZW0627]
MILASAFLNQLQQGTVDLKPIYLFHGEEALFLRDCVDGLRQNLQSQGYLFGDRYEVDAGFDWQSLQMETQAGSLFSEQRVVMVSMPKGSPGTDGTKFIQDWANLTQAQAGMPPEVIVLLECEKLDSRQLKSKWVSAIESAGLVVQAKPVPTQALPGWCQQKAVQYGLQLEPEAAALLAERVEGNLLAADQELIKLSLLYPANSSINAQIIADSVVDQAHYQLFALATSMLLGKSDHAQQMLLRLRQEGLEAPVILWLLAKEIRQLVELSQLRQSMPLAQAYKQLRIWQSRQNEVGSALQRHQGDYWQGLLKEALQIDLMIKGIRKTLDAEEVWMGLTALVNKIAN